MPTISTCGGCSNVFTSTAAFDAHRVGDFEKPIYAEGDTKKKKPIGYTRPTRRCMTLAELHAAGFCSERRPVTGLREGVTFREEREVWFDPAAREQARKTFSDPDKEPEAEGAQSFRRVVDAPSPTEAMGFNPASRFAVL